MRTIIFAIAAAGLIAGSGPSLAAPCKDKQGKFVKCPEKPKMCRDAKGHFAPCPAPQRMCRNAQGHFAKCK